MTSNSCRRRNTVKPPSNIGINTQRIIFLAEGNQSYFSQVRIMKVNIIATATIYIKVLQSIAETILFLSGWFFPSWRDLSIILLSSSISPKITFSTAKIIKKDFRATKWRNKSHLFTFNMILLSPISCFN